MKKIILSLAALLAATAFAPQASAVPAFARQTGKACTTCHFQHFPALNEYGQDFKANGYTEIGKQAIVKGDDVSLPGILNASLFLKARYQKTNGTDGYTATGDAVKTTHSGAINLPDEFALLIGGRVTENIGFLVESQFAGKQGNNFLAGFKMPMMFAVNESGMKAGVVPFLTDGLGASYGFELLSTGAVRNIRVNEHRRETSSHQYVFFNTAGAASGLAFALYDPRFHVAYTKYTPHTTAEVDSNIGGLDAGLIRAVWTPTVGEFALGVGVQSYIGSNMRFIDAGVLSYVDTKGTALDVQAQGVVGSMPLGVYLTYATAPGSDQTAGAVQNLFNANAGDRKATTLLTEFGIVPNKATVQLAYRIADNGAASNNNDNAWTVAGIYHMAQNVQLSLTHTKNTGDARYDDSPAGATGNAGGDSLTTLMLASGF